MYMEGFQTRSEFYDADNPQYPLVPRINEVYDVVRTEAVNERDGLIGSKKLEEKVVTIRYYIRYNPETPYRAPYT